MKNAGGKSTHSKKSRSKNKNMMVGPEAPGTKAGGGWCQSSLSAGRSAIRLCQ